MMGRVCDTCNQTVVVRIRVYSQTTIKERLQKASEGNEEKAADTQKSKKIDDTPKEDRSTPRLQEQQMDETKPRRQRVRSTPVNAAPAPVELHTKELSSANMMPESQGNEFDSRNDHRVTRVVPQRITDAWKELEDAQRAEREQRQRQPEGSRQNQIERPSSYELPLPTATRAASSSQPVQLSHEQIEEIDDYADIVPTSRTQMTTSTHERSVSPASNGTSGSEEDSENLRLYAFG